MHTGETVDWGRVRRPHGPGILHNRFLGNMEWSLMPDWTCRFIRHFQRVSFDVPPVHMLQCLHQPLPQPSYPLSKKIRSHSNFANTSSPSIRKSIDERAIGLANLTKKVKEMFGGVFRGKISDAKGLAQKRIGIPVVLFHGVHLGHLTGRQLARGLTTQDGLLHLHSSWPGGFRSRANDVSPRAVGTSYFRTNFRPVRPSAVRTTEFLAFAFNGVLVTRTNIARVR